MSNKVSGVLARVLTKDWNGKTLYSITVEGDERIFGLGANRPMFGVGVPVEFEVKRNQKGYWDANIGSLITKPLPVKQVEQGVQPVMSAPANAYKTPLNKDKVIELQSCRNSAVALIDVLVTSQAVKLPTKKDEQYDCIVDLVDELVGRFVEQNDRVREGKNFLEEPKPEPEMVLEEPTPNDEWKE